MKCEKCGVEIMEGNLCNNCKNSVPVQGQVLVAEKKKPNVLLIVLIVIVSIVVFGIIMVSALTYFAMKNVNGMFDQAKSNTFVTEVQKYMDSSKTQFMQDAMKSGGESIIYSNLNVDDANLLDLDPENEKKYYIVYDRNGNYVDVVIYDDSFCYKADIEPGEYFDKTNVRLMDIHVHNENDSISGCVGNLAE